MTRKRVAFAVLGVGLVLGIAYVAATYGYTLGYSEGHAQSAASHGFEKAVVLPMLRRGDVDAAIDSIELDLNTDIMIASTSSPEIDQRLNVFDVDPSVQFRLMQKIADYRSKYPHAESIPEVRSMIQRELKKYPPIICPPN